MGRVHCAVKTPNQKKITKLEKSERRIDLSKKVKFWKMQGAKKAGETIKETAANVGASAKSGMEKTKATVQEKVTINNQ